MTHTPSGQRPAPSRPRFRNLGLLPRLKAYFIAGVLVTAPLAITLYLSWQFIAVIDNTVARILPAPYDPASLLPIWIPGLGLALVVVVLTLIGAFAAGYLGRLLLRLGEAMVGRMPVVRGLYAATKQIVETVLANTSQAFREVVLVEFPRPGVWTLGFITAAPCQEVRRHLVTDATRADAPAPEHVPGHAPPSGPEPVWIGVFVPTTPNPTSGYLLFFPESQVRRLSMSVEEGIKLVVSGGIVTPENHPAPPAS